MSRTNLTPELKTAIELIQQAGGLVRFPRKEIRVWNEVFSSWRAVSKDSRCEVCYLTLIQRIAQGVAPDEAVKVIENSVRTPVICWGEHFKSVKDLANDPRCNVSYNSLSRKLKNGEMPEEAVNDTRLRAPITTIEQAIVQ
jgi:hypothetical protein